MDCYLNYLHSLLHYRVIEKTNDCLILELIRLNRSHRNLTLFLSGKHVLKNRPKLESLLSCKLCLTPARDGVAMNKHRRQPPAGNPLDIQFF